MRGRASAVLFSLLLAAPVFAQCPYRLDASWQFRASYLDLSIDGNDLWAATGYGVQLIDRSADPPRLIASAAIPGLTRVIRGRDGVAYAGSGTSVFVLRKNGAQIEQIRSLDLSATINDLLLHETTLFAATPAGLVPIDVARPLEPSPLPVQLSGRNVQSLARFESTLFAGDGDNTVEVVDLSTAGAPSQLNSVSLGASVNVVGTRLYVSDGQQTDVFSLGASPLRLATMPFGAMSIAPAATNVVFAAGNDRRLRALDISVLETPVDLFTAELPVTFGTINRIGAIQVAGSRLYAGGGDSGLFTFDTSAFVSPYPVRNYFVGSKSSVVATTSAIYVSNSTGGFTEMTRSLSGSLTVARTWGAQPAVAFDTASDFLLTGSGATLTFWTIRSTTPSAIATATFRAAVKSAVLAGATAYALLQDGSLWSADLAQAAPTPVQVGTGTYSFLDRFGSSIATAELTQDATTIVRYYANGDLHSGPVTATVEGVTPVFAVGSGFAAVFTFRGITVIDFAGTTPSLQTVLPQSNTANAADLAFANGKLLDATANAVHVWNLSTFKVDRQFAISEPLMIAVSADTRFAGVVTGDGVASISYESDSKQPALVATIGGSDFNRKAAGTQNRLYLFDGRSIDIYETVVSGLPRFVTTLQVSAVIDIAASDSALFTLSNTGTVVMFSPSGTLLRTGALNEGTDVVPSSIFAVRGAPWVALSKGCVSTGCERKTIVFDPQSFIPSSSIAGGALDVATSGTNAAAIFELPGEVRYYNVSDPLHPSPNGARAIEGSAASVAATPSSVFALGDKLYTYSTPALAKGVEQFTPQTPTTATRVAIDGGCAVVTGRSNAAEVYAWSASQWSAAGALPLPANVRSIVVANERLTILTDYSVEIWSRGAKVTAPRRRAAR